MPHVAKRVDAKFTTEWRRRHLGCARGLCDDEKIASDRKKHVVDSQRTVALGLLLVDEVQTLRLNELVDETTGSSSTAHWVMSV